MPTLFGRSPNPKKDKSAGGAPTAPDRASKTLPAIAGGGGGGRRKSNERSVNAVASGSGTGTGSGNALSLSPMRSAPAPPGQLGPGLDLQMARSPLSSSGGGGGAGSLGRNRFSGGSGNQRGSGMGEFGGLPSGVGAMSRTLPAQTAGPLTPPDSPPAPVLPPKYIFLPTKIPTMSHSTSIDSFMYSSEDVVGFRPYGFLGGVGGRAVLGVEEVGQVIQDVGLELGRRGLTTPMLFSNQALELNPTKTRNLIQSYMDAIRNSGGNPRQLNAWVQDLKFARDHELAWMFRWALSRLTRIKEGSREVYHGVIEWDVYEEWRGRERASNYPLDAFPYLSALIPSQIFGLIVSPLFNLLSKFAAYSHISGLTPHTLSSLFAPLLFDIPTSTSCMTSHTTFVRAASATEHLLLSYIRTSSRRGGLGMTDLPSRLKEWVAGYPSMVASDADLARANPRRGARVLRCERASRTVRAYSKDLIVNSESWAGDVVGSWDAWDSVILRGRRGENGRPKFSSGWRRKMAVKEMPPLPSSSSTSSELNRKMSYGRAQKPGFSPPQHRKDKRGDVEGEDEARYGSLAGKEWSMFEEGGFDSPSKGGREELKSKLQFDLNESAKLGISERRRTMDWSEFASDAGGFNRTDPLLDISLTFSTPLSESITEWPKERDDLQRRLHKSQKAAAPFNYDTTPRVGASVSQDPGARADGKGRVYIEEAFVDCWADWMMGGGWTDREELTFKEANWALIEYKARPTRGDEVTRGDPLVDPRTSDLYILFEERVPLEYQMAVADPKQKKTFGLFSSKKKRGASNTLGGTPRSPHGRPTPSEFDRMLVHRDRTKKLTLSSKSDAPNTAIWHVTPSPDVNTKFAATLPRSPNTHTGSPLSPLKRENPRRRTRSSGRGGGGDGLGAGSVNAGDDPKMTEGKASFFSMGMSKNKDKVVRRVKTDESTREKFKRDRERQKEREIEFELQSASGLSSPDDTKSGGQAKKGGKKKNKAVDDDKWMDILIANGAKPMDRQDAPSSQSQQKGGKAGPAGGLPVSPHPPRQYSPQPPQAYSHGQGVPADFDPYAAHHRESIDSEPVPYNDHYGEIDSQEHDHDQGLVGHQHSPETLGSVDPHEAVTPEEPGELTRFPSWKRKPVPKIQDGEQATASQPQEEGFDDPGPPIPPPKSEARNASSGTGPRDRAGAGARGGGVREGEILSPSPTRQRDTRDTIHNIVDVYNRDSMLSASDSDFEPATADDAHDREGHRRSNEIHFESTGPRDKDRLTPPDGDGARRGGGGGEERDSIGEMRPPGMVFDLTPGREPSPARYKHGEPLAFVGEEEEEE